MADRLHLHCLLCAEIRSSRLMQSISDASNGIKDNLLACGLWVQSFDRENMPQIVCSGCVNELSRCHRFFQQIAKAEQKLLQLCPIKCDPLIAEETNWDYGGDDFPNHDDSNGNNGTDRNDEIFCEPWIKLEPNSPSIPKKVISQNTKTNTKRVDCEAVSQQSSAPKRPNSRRVYFSKISTKKPTPKATSSNETSPENAITGITPAPVQPYLLTNEPTEPIKQQIELPTHFRAPTPVLLNIEPIETIEQRVDESMPSAGESDSNDDDPTETPNRSISFIQFKCEHCLKQFPNEVCLNIHKRVVCFAVEPQNRLECDICKLTYRNINSIRNHMKKHAEGISAFMCDRCGECFENNLQLSNHIRSHARQRNLDCRICGKRLTRPDKLKQHMQLHNNTKPHRCHLCDKSYQYKNGLDLHMLSHTGELPYKCRHCGKGYQQKSTLKLHERTHTGERPYKCDLCDYAGIGSANLRNHTLNIHGLKLNVKRPRLRNN